MAKNAPFHIKSPVKNFHGPAKGGGHRTVALPPNTPLGLGTYSAHTYVQHVLAQLSRVHSEKLNAARDTETTHHKAVYLK